MEKRLSYAMAFLFSRYPYIVYHPQSPPFFFTTSDELLFLNFWYLKKDHPEYRKMQTQAVKLVENNPALWKLINESRVQL